MGCKVHGRRQRQGPPSSIWKLNTVLRSATWLELRAPTMIPATCSGHPNTLTSSRGAGGAQLAAGCRRATGADAGQVKQGAAPADGRQSTADTTPRTCGLSKTHLQATSAIVTPCFLAAADSACSRLCRRRHSRLRLSTSTVDLWQLAGGHLLQRHGPACSSRPDQACPAASSCMPPQTARLSSTHPFQTHKQGFTWNQSQPPAWPMTEAYLDLE